MSTAIALIRATHPGPTVSVTIVALLIGVAADLSALRLAILGVVRSKMAPVWDGQEFRPRLMLPISLSYDHRVIDGALAARFSRHLCHVLEDVRRLVL